MVTATGPQYGVAPLPRSHKPPKARPYEEYRDCLRLEFAHTCAYCLATEREVGPSDKYGGFVAKGARFIDPCIEPLGKYLSIKGDRVVAVGADPAGQYVIEEVNLNSAQHIERRQLRKKLARNFALLEATRDWLRGRVQPGARDEAQILAEFDRMTQVLKDLRLKTGVPPSPPWDAPVGCGCPAP